MLKKRKGLNDAVSKNRIISEIRGVETRRKLEEFEKSPAGKAWRELQAKRSVVELGQLVWEEIVVTIDDYLSTKANFNICTRIVAIDTYKTKTEVECEMLHVLNPQGAKFYGFTDDFGVEHKRGDRFKYDLGLLTVHTAKTTKNIWWKA